MKVSHKLFLLSVLPFLVIIIFIFFVSKFQIETILKRQISKTAHEELNYHAKDIESFFSLKIAELKLMAATPVVQQGNIANILEYFKQEQKRLSQHIEGIYYNDLGGTVYDVSGSTFNVRDRYYFPQIDRGQIVITKIIKSRSTQRPIVLILVPVFDSKGIRTGAIGGTILVKDILQLIQDIKVGNMGFAIMIDEDHRMISSFNQINRSKNDPLLDPIEKHEFNSDSQKFFKSILSLKPDIAPIKVTHDKSSYQAYFKPVKLMRWVLVLLYDENEIQIELNNLKTIYFLMSLCIIIAISFFIYGNKRIVLDPIKALIKLQQQFGEGQLSARSSNISLDEFGTLSLSFNQMADQLSERTRSLEKEVVERKRAESRIRAEKQFTDTALDAQMDTFFLFNSDSGKALRWNRAFSNISGYTNAEIAELPALESYYGTGDLERVKAFIQDIQQTGTGTIELELICKNGRRVPTEYRVSIVLADNGDTPYLISIGRDISERKALEAEKKRIEFHIQQSQKLESIGTLAGGIAHDFNNMLGVIIGNISLALTQSHNDEELYGILSNAQDGAKQAQNLTHQLLTFAKGGVPIKKAMDINNLIRESAIFSMRGAKTDCHFDFSNNLWPTEVDEGQINQVIGNLVINANQAMPNGGKITIQTENVTIESNTILPLPAGRYVKINVEDQGCGIPKKHLQNIFDPYFTTKQKGSGLGLASTYSIIKKHDGHISVYSEIEKGTVFTIYLPASLKNIEKTEKVGDTSHQGFGKVLIMDDQEGILEMVGMMLNRMGYEASLVTDGVQAIEIYRASYELKQPFDLVILDLTIPGGMGGANTLIELLKIDPNVKAVVSSGYSSDSIMANYQGYGFCGVVSKPYTMNQLAELLNKILGEKT